MGWEPRWRSGLFMTRGQCYKTFFVHNLRIFVISQSVCLGNPFQPSLMFACKAEAYPSEALFRCSTLGQAPGLTRKHQTRLQKLARDKHSNLLQKSVNYRQKSFITLAPGGQNGKGWVEQEFVLLIIAALPSEALLPNEQISYWIALGHSIPFC